MAKPATKGARKSKRAARNTGSNTTAKTATRRSTPREDVRPGATAPFPRTTFEDALALGNAIQQFGGGQKIQRLTLFEMLDKSPESSGSRMMITNSSKYGITRGGYQAESLELTDLGQTATNPDSTPEARTRARFELAIRGVAAFNHLYEQYKGRRIPSPEVLRDSLAEIGITPAHRKECVELFLENGKFLGILRTSAGAERLYPFAVAVTDSDAKTTVRPAEESDGEVLGDGGKRRNLKKVCFVISPISSDGSEERKHADMVLALIERALEGEDFEVVRADKIGDPGMISEQVIRYLLYSGLVIADLSFHNPNVFYELAARHLLGRPTVHIIRTEDFIPFDVKDFRTIHIDTRDKYDLIAKLETYRAEIANHARMALLAGSEGSNPIRAFAKGLVVELKDE